MSNAIRGEQLNYSDRLRTILPHSHQRCCCLELLILQFAGMRSYGKNYKVNGASKPYTSAKEYRTRESTEWDVRVDCVNGITPETIRDQMQMRLPDIVYGLIGGLERADVPSPAMAAATGLTATNWNGTVSKEDHVHIALVFLTPVCRATALKMCREAKLGDEYATPRNKKFTYAGWLAHHTKAAWKVDPEAPKVFYEYGTLPMDSYDEDTCWKVVKILKKFATPDVKLRFSSYYDALDQHKEAKAAKALPAPVVPDYLVAMLPKEE